MIDLKNFNPIKNTRKKMISVNLPEHKEILESVLKLDGILYDILPEVYDDILHNSGIPKNISRILKNNYKDAWVTVIEDLYDYYYNGIINMLVTDNDVTAVYHGKSVPVLNHEFVNYVMNFLSDYQELYVDSYTYDPDSSTSSVTIYPTKTKDDYRIGVMVVNDEASNTQCYKVVQKGNLKFYLPSKYYKVSSSRYLKSAENSMEALSLMLLRVTGDLLSDSWYNICSEINMQLTHCDRIPTTYEEYRYATRLARRVAITSEMSDEESKDLIEKVFSDFEDFESHYPDLDDAKKSYLWRCSALSDTSIGVLVESLSSLSNNYSLYPESREEVLYLIGEFIMLDKISTVLAKRHER